MHESEAARARRGAGAGNDDGAATAGRTGPEEGEPGTDVAAEDFAGSEPDMTGPDMTGPAWADAAAAEAAAGAAVDVPVADEDLGEARADTDASGPETDAANGGAANGGAADDGAADDGAADGGAAADIRELVPPGESLRRSGRLAEEDILRVEAHQEATGLDFDNAAVILGLAASADVLAARAPTQRSLTLPLQPSRGVSDELVVLSDPSSPRAEALRLLRTQVISQHIGTGRRAFAVAGAVEGSGVTFIAANLAAALSQVGIKTLLVDANLRGPRIDSIFGIEPAGPGLTTFLGMQASRPERILYPDVLPNLSIIPAGPPVPRPQELLSGARFRAGVDILLREFDVAIFDTAPANESADALTVAGVLGYALLVAHRNTAYVRDVQVLTEQLGAARASVIGSVLNVYQ